jgi:hypothetical protein
MSAVRRSGTILIIVAGIAAILAAMTLAFLMRMRSDSEESLQLTKEIQARVMLSAGLMYVSETARLGWDKESFGWCDLRTGLPGPRDNLGNMLYTGNAADGKGANFPAVEGAAARCPMYVMRRPPYAIKMKVTYNPIPLDATKSWAELISGEELDPQPESSTWADFVAGDKRPGPAAMVPSWFRVYRSGIATFIITCGAGPSLGYRTWNEVVADGQQDLFGSSEAFDEARRSDAYFWYQAEWNAAIAASSFNHYEQDFYGWRLQPVSTPMGGNMPWYGLSNDDRAVCRQFTGTFTYIEWLANEPANW